MNLCRDGDRVLELLILSEEFLLSASHQLTLITSLPVVHTARRSCRSIDPANNSNTCINCYQYCAVGCCVNLVTQRKEKSQQGFRRWTCGRIILTNQQQTFVWQCAATNTHKLFIVVFLTIGNNYTHSIHYSNNHLPHEIVWCFKYVQEAFAFNLIDADTWSVFAICMHLLYHRIWFGIGADILTCSDICVGSASDESCCELRCAVWIARPRELK